MNLTESEILQSALDWRESGRAVALCTVVETWGASPKPVGSHLIVDSDGVFLGSVSGGCVEGDVVAEAIDVIASGGPRILEFGVSDGLAWQAGLTCGGRIKIFVERFDEDLAACLAVVLRDGTVIQPTVLVTAFDGGRPKIVGAIEQMAHPLASEIADVLQAGKSRLASRGDHFLTALLPATRLIVFGAVHIAQALAPIAKLAGLEMIVVDPRSAFATAERFPDVRLVADWPSDVAAEIKPAATDAVAALSHDPKIDDQALRLALGAGCFYVGALGSQRSHARRLDRLREAGVADHDLRRIHAPIGLDIGAQGPTEIAVAILAEIISVRRGRTIRRAAAA